MCPLVSGITTRDAALSAELGMRALDLAVGRTAPVHSEYVTLEEHSGGSSSSDENGVLQDDGHLVIKLLESEDVKGGFYFIIN